MIADIVSSRQIALQVGASNLANEASTDCNQIILKGTFVSGY